MKKLPKNTGKAGPVRLKGPQKRKGNPVKKGKIAGKSMGNCGGR